MQSPTWVGLSVNDKRKYSDVYIPHLFEFVVVDVENKLTKTEAITASDLVSQTFTKIVTSDLLFLSDQLRARIALNIVSANMGNAVKECSRDNSSTIYMHKKHTQ